MSRKMMSYPSAPENSARTVFFDLFDGQMSAPELERSAHFLCEQLDEAAKLECDLPADKDGLIAWMEAGVVEVGHRYHGYLEARKAGAPRRYFRNKSHALYFLKSVAPTKLVDGAWLYGLLPRWQDPRFLSLIQTYLEELGEGLPTKNHVVLFEKLLATQGCEKWDDLSDNHYIQGAIQLSLAYNVDQFLPEVIGFNLGYEQLPLHLLITAYELKELGIDPYYFTLHITVDNADSGHARKAVDAISAATPRLGDSDEFYCRVKNGYMLNDLGASTTSVIGEYAHSDYRQVAGRTVNDWLSDPSQTAEFLVAMEKEGWFKRHQDPQNSRFWKLIEGDKARMFGVFSPYEQQVIFDWIAGDANHDGAAGTKFKRLIAKPLETDAKTPLLTTPTEEAPEALSTTSSSDFDAEVRALQQNIATATSQPEVVDVLIGLLSPANHHSAAGLMATRIFNDMLGNAT
jgi:hypothetical protein